MIRPGYALRLVVGLLLSFLVAGLLASFTQTQSALAVRPPAESDAAQELGSCLSSEKGGDLLILMDQSGSLKDSDPDAKRVESARYLVSRLSATAQENGLDLNIAVAGFDADYIPRSKWQPVGKDGAADTLAALEQFRDQNSGVDTDYWSALEGARRALRDQVRATGGEDRCQAIVLFTDGEYYVNPGLDADGSSRTKPYAPEIDLDTEDAAARVEKLGRKAMCRKGGLVDQLRKSDVKIFVVGLQGGADKSDFGLVRAIGDGSGPETCGGVKGAGIGDFTLAENIGDLLFAFDALTSPGQPPLEKETPICTDDGCQEGAHTVVLDTSIRAVRILAGSDFEATKIEIRGPKSKDATTVVSGSDGSSNVGRVPVAWEWVSPTVVEITVQRGKSSDRDWSGVWSVTFVNENAPKGALARTNIHVEGDLVMAVADPDGVDWRTGGELEGLEFQIVRTGSGTEVDPESIVSAVKMSAELKMRDGTRISIMESENPQQGTSPRSVDLSDINPGRGALSMMLDVTTAPARGPSGKKYPGTKLSPQVSQMKVRVQPPLNYPTVASEVVDFGLTEETGPLGGVVSVTGPGCVWLADSTIDTSPDQVDVSIVAPDAQSEADCLKLGDGASGDLQVQLTASEVGNGSVTGDLILRTAASEDLSRTLDVAVPYLVDMRKPVDATRRNLVFGVLLAAGVLAPMALLWGMAWWRSRIPGESLIVARVEVEVDGDSVRRKDTGDLLGVAPEEYQILTVPGEGARSLSLPGGVQLDANVKNPLAPHVVVTAPGQTVVTKTRPEPFADSGRLPLAVHQNWILLRDSSGSLTAVFLVSGLADQTKRDELVADVQRQAAESANRWRADGTGPIEDVGPRDEPGVWGAVTTDTPKTDEDDPWG